MKIKDLKQEHPLIYKRALECQVEQGNEANDELELHFSTVSGGFIWYKTKEGQNIWESVDKRNFQLFYYFHKQSQYPKVMMVSDDGNRWLQRVVFMKMKEKYFAWSYANTLEESEEQTELVTWTYVKDIKPQIKLTRQEIADKFEVDLEQIEILD